MLLRGKWRTTALHVENDAGVRKERLVSTWVPCLVLNVACDHMGSPQEYAMIAVSAKDADGGMIIKKVWVGEVRLLQQEIPLV